MKVECRRWGASPANAAKGLPPAAVGFVFCAFAIGPIGALAVVVVIFAAIFALLYLLKVEQRRRWSSPVDAAGVLLQTSAGLEGNPGGVRFYNDRAEFLVRDNGGATHVEEQFVYNSISLVTLSKHVFPAVFTRAAFKSSDGSVRTLDVNASKPEILGVLQRPVAENIP